MENPPESVFDEDGNKFVLLENVAEEVGFSYDDAYQMVYDEGVPRVVKFRRTYIPTDSAYEISWLEEIRPV